MAFSPNTIRDKRSIKAASYLLLARVSAHTCRHWFAVNSIKQGLTVDLCMQLSYTLL
jgi:hypothetical protein